MGRSLIQRYQLARDLLEIAVLAVGADGEKLRDGLMNVHETAVDSEQLEAWNRELAETSIAQPAICLVSVLWLDICAALASIQARYVGT